MFFFLLLTLTTFNFCSLAFGQDSFDINLLKELMQKEKVTSVDQLIPLLPKELRDNVTLVYESKSIQEGSPESPRAILHSPDGKFILTFNGDHTQKGYNEVEVMQFNSAEKNFELFEVSFPKEPNSPVHFSDKNPSKCLACHQSNPKPIWESYFNWPGVYGSIDGSSTESRGGYTPDRNEKEYLNKFKKLAPNHPRYKHVSYLKNEGMIEANSMVFNIKDPAEISGGQASVLTKKLISLNAIRVGKEISEWPHFQELKYQLALAIEGCPGSRITYTDTLKYRNKGGLWKNQAALLASIETVYNQNGYEMPTITEADLKKWLMPFDAKASLEKGFESNFDGNINLIGLAPWLGFYGLPMNDPELLDAYTTVIKMKNSIEGKKYVKSYLLEPSTFSSMKGEFNFCESLQKKQDSCAKTNRTPIIPKSVSDPIQEVYTYILDNNQKKEDAAIKIIQNQCMACHDDGMIGTYIPLHDSKKMSQLFRQKPLMKEDILLRINPKTQKNKKIDGKEKPLKMPLNGELSREEYMILKDFFETLGSDY